MSGKRVIVVGAGISGLVAAATLAKDGFEVTIIEKNDTPGGRLSETEHKGYRFQLSPLTYLMPKLFEKVFKEFESIKKIEYKLNKLSPLYKVFMNEDRAFSISDRLSNNLKLFNDIEPGADEKLVEYLADAEYKYKLFAENVFAKDLSAFTTLFDRDMVVDSLRLQLWRSMESHVESYFKSPVLRDLLSFASLQFGCSPKTLPSFYSLTTHAELNDKVWYPKGGLKAIIDELVTLCEKLEVKFIFNEEIIKVKTVERSATTLISKNSNTYEVDFVVANADYAHFETRLLDHTDATILEESWDHRKFAPSAIVAWIGVNKKLKNLEHTNLFLDTDLSKFYSELFEKRAVSERPAFYLTVPSRTDSTAAPKGGEALTITIPIPAGASVSDEDAERLVQDAIKRIEERCGVVFAKDIVFEDIMTDRYFSDRFNAYRDSALGLSHAFGQDGFLRPANKSRRIENLYYVGGSTLPGLGLAAQLISGQLGGNRLKSDQSTDLA